MKYFIVLAGALSAAAGLSGAELTVSNLFAAHIQGTNALEEFRAMLTPQNAPALGFASTNEAAQAALGKPFRVYQVPLGQLQSYQSGTFNTLLEPAPRVIFPIVVDAQTKSSVIVRMESGQWVTDKFGGSGLVKNLSTARHVLAGQDQQWADESFAVEVPVLALWFVGYTNDLGRVQLMTPTQLRMGGLTIASNKTVTPAFMKKLGEVANRYSGRSN